MTNQGPKPQTETLPDHALFFVPLVWLTELPPGLERGVKVILAHRIELDPTEKQKEPRRERSDQPETKYRGLHGNQRLGTGRLWLGWHSK